MPRDRVLEKDIVHTVLNKAQTKQLSTNVDETMRNLFEVMTSIRPYRSFIQLIKKAMRPRALHITKKQTAIRLAGVVALSAILTFLHKDTRE